MAVTHPLPQGYRRIATNRIAYGWSPTGSHHLRLVLHPAERRRLVVLLGYHENPRVERFDPSDSQTFDKRSLRPILQRHLDPAQVEVVFANLRAYWTDLLDALQVQTPDVHTDRMVNIWNPYQCIVTFKLSRSASHFESGIGFRDSNQDLLGFAPPDRARSAVDAVFAHLNSLRGNKLVTSAYDGYDPVRGGIITHPPGAKENAGIFFHGNPWAAIAEAMLGNGDRAYACLSQINPAAAND